MSVLVFADGQQLSRPYRCVNVLDAHQFCVPENYAVLDEPSRRIAHHHPTGRSDGLHALSHADLVTNCGVTQSSRADFAGYHRARVHADAKLKFDRIAALYIRREALGLHLNPQRGETSAKTVILQSNGSPEDGHESVAGELVDRAAIARDDSCRALDEFGHDLA